jgi:glycosyltransferase involved in cell wall biosynthesis
MKEPTFSICIPNYNYAHFIGETIQSVIDQTYPHFEIIVADNASTDSSVEVIQSIKDERLHLVRNRFNIGFAPNLQRVASQAHNDFILLLSSDDRMQPHALETYRAVLENAGQEASNTILFAEALTIDGQGQPLPHKVPQPAFYQVLPCEKYILPGGTACLRYSGREVLKAALRRLCSVGPFLSMAYPRRLFDAVEGYNSVHLTDPDTHFTHKILTKEPQVAWVMQPLFEYRLHASSQLSQQRRQASIKKPIDKYLYTLDTSDSLLQSLGLTRQELVKAFIYRYCVNETFHYLGRGAYAQAWKGLMFGLTTYPSQVLRTPRAYALAALLLCGPLAAPLTRLARSVFRSLGGQDE